MRFSAAGRLRKQPHSVYRREQVYISPSNMLDGRRGKSKTFPMRRRLHIMGLGGV